MQPSWKLCEKLHRVVISTEGGGKAMFHAPCKRAEKLCDGRHDYRLSKDDPPNEAEPLELTRIRNPSED